MNNFIKLYFDKKTLRITLQFINQPKESDKHYMLRYGPDHKHLQHQAKGRLTHSNSVTVEVTINPEDAIICLAAIVTNGTKTVSMEGFYDIMGK